MAFRAENYHVERHFKEKRVKKHVLACFQTLTCVASQSEATLLTVAPGGAEVCYEKQKNSNYDMMGIFVQLCFNMGLRFEELRASHEELLDYVDELHEKISQFDKELEKFRDSLEV